MKGFSACLMAVAIAVTTFAGEGGGIGATVDAGRSLQNVNVVIPPKVNESYKYYEVSGLCETDLCCDLKQKCFRMKDGKKYDSVTSWKMKWDYARIRSPQACTTDFFTVTVDVVFHLPKWVRTGEAPQPLVEKWNSYMEKLMIHEQGHRDRAVEAANELTRAVAELPPAPTCAVLDREINNLLRTRKESLIKNQEKYDDETKHGVTQGVLFP
jgi:predicted secreted Zn-dependent protease